MKSECVLRVLSIFLKPENILIDFGLADNDAFYVWKTLGCTKEYASPELISQSKDIDARSDIYSIGIIMREIFGGRYTRIQKKCTSEKRENRYSELDELQRVWNGRNKIWKFMAALSVLVTIIIPTLLYISMLKGEEQKIDQRDILIQEVKSEISRIFDESQGDVLKMAEEYTEYQNKIISETEDVELRNVLQNEMVLHYTKEFERVFWK